MQIIESFTCSKKVDPNANEDMLWIGKWFCLVADGVTSKTNAVYCGKTGGQIAVECIVSALERMTGEEDIRTALEQIRQTISAYVLEHQLSDLIRPQASVLIYNHLRRELWSVGDCRFLLNGVYHKNEKKLDTLLSALRKMAIEALLLEGHSEADLLEHDLSREMILPFLQRQSLFIDTTSEFSYSIIDNAHTPNQITVLPVPKGSELVMATDGYPVLKGTLADSEAALEAALQEDPLCYKLYPSTKGLGKDQLSFDDRTYLRLIT